MEALQLYPVTIIIMVATIIATFYVWNKPYLAEKYIFSPYRIKHNKEYHRFVTSGFMHAMDQPGGYMHLGFNMYAFYLFGRNVEYYLWYDAGFSRPVGMLIFLGLYFLGMIAADIPAYFKHKDNYGYSALGSSGAVSAVVFANILFDPTSLMGLIIIPFVWVPAFLLGTLYLIYSYWQSKKGTGRIAHDAHFWGAIFGLIYMVAVYPEIINDLIEGFKSWDMRFISFGSGRRF